MKLPKLLSVIRNIMSSLIYYVFTLACFYIYLSSITLGIKFIFMFATILWFYSFLIELGYLFGFLEDKK